MGTRSARVGALVALALVAAPAPAGAQSLLERLNDAVGQVTTPTTPATTPTTATATAPVPAPAATTPAPAADPNAAAPAPGATTPAPPAAANPPAGADSDEIVAAARQDRGASAVPSVLVALGVLAVLLALGALAWAVARWLAWEPRFAQRFSHAGREAAYRASGVWADFADWVRLGR